MFKKIISLLIILYTLTNTYGSFLKNVPQTVKQPDGTIIHCFASGDEYHHWLHDSAGYTIVIHETTGFYTYAQNINDELVATNYVVGTINPANVGIEKGKKNGLPNVRNLKLRFRLNLRIKLQEEIMDILII